MMLDMLEIFACPFRSCDASLSCCRLGYIRSRSCILYLINNEFVFVSGPPTHGISLVLSLSRKSEISIRRESDASPYTTRGSWERRALKTDACYIHWPGAECLRPTPIRSPAPDYSNEPERGCALRPRRTRDWSKIWWLDWDRQG